ncbi:MAG: SUMF1/EgtB/PvdO family nonheme iron enzyme [Deltaproteobacteria bacterium]|nr:SUMF1/EgtB/PvdO family nonheme iron enzyme [Deltaproteobacteria bacterium]MBK8235196.1 SUMF1/EgtB/PvdO family nonheme iron enzyme [Deltaproteobacteria bacterium]MBK8716484.1 SUMF1/EgtB/PvdO family nonheme iron enzyme [Deltaproteobacteria bacterium]MBP7287326.1 SUMF1/EgtB/PvdO family nonheme iron enzyme [Nannocystaceae bacterium]
MPTAIQAPSGWLLALALGGCVHAGVDTSETVTIAGGWFAMGASLDERTAAIDDAVKLGGDARAAATSVRRELARHRARIGTYHMMVHPVTQQEYARYVYATGAAEPWVDRQTWARTQALDDELPGGDPRTFTWVQGRPRREREHAPAVLVSQPEAAAYCEWWGEQHRGFGSLPTEAQWERAARGDDARVYPWGDRFVASLVNTREGGAGDLQPVGARPATAGPHGVQDLAGNAAEWTASFERGHAVVKGAAWSDPSWRARASSRRLVAPTLRHVVIGFRCVLDPTARP